MLADEIRRFSVALHHPMLVRVLLFVVVGPRRLALESLLAIVAPKPSRLQARVLFRLLLLLHFRF